MKLLLSERDKKFIDMINNGDFSPDMLLYNEIEEEYSINFKIIDLGKANNFLFALFNVTINPSEETKDLIDATGIKITSCNGFPAKIDFNRNELKEQLQRIVDSL